MGIRLREDDGGCVGSIKELLDRTWALNRSLANDDFDRALAEIASVLSGLEVHEFQSGESALDWVVPERWELQSARVVDQYGKVVIDASEQPLHVVSYSLPKQGWVSREELLAHLHSDPSNPDAIPYRYAFYERDWGLCCSDRIKQSLEGESFEVELKTELKEGPMKVGELVLPGARPESLLFIGHLDHPMQVNDGLLGALVLVELARVLMARPSRHWTYRFLFVPERIGSTAWIARFFDDLPSLAGGLFCEMPGVPGQSLSLQLTKWGDTKVDRVLAKLIEEAEPGAPILPCWKHVVNDEGVFNAPGVDVPVASVSRSAPGNAFQHFPQYHSDGDVPKLVDWDGVAGTLQVLKEFCEIMEADRIPMPTYAGDPFLSKHGLWVDWQEDPQLNMAMEDIHHSIDGQASLFDISESLRLPFGTVLGFVERMAKAGLVDWAPADRIYSQQNPWEARAARLLPAGVAQAGMSPRRATEDSLSWKP